MICIDESAGCDSAAKAKARLFIDIDYFQKKKKGENAAGDVFLSQITPSKNRIIAVLSDGLGSGIKANVLASLTATMISRFMLMDMPPERAEEIIVNSLPVCSERALAYATFTLIDARFLDMAVRIIEYDNPPLLILRGTEPVGLQKEKRPIERKNKKTGPQNEAIYLSELTAQPGDRIIFFSDGVTQAGLGLPHRPFGWGSEEVSRFIVETVRADPCISARALARAVVLGALRQNPDGPKDDTSCAVMYFRKPRNLLVLTGPPFRPESDGEFARVFAEFNGRKIISGGTSAQIISRELGIPLYTEGGFGGLPVTSRLAGADLVCEGILTLGAVAGELAEDEGDAPCENERNPASRMTALLLDSDTITFLVGTKINEAHQDPTMPVELEIRRNVVKRIAELLEEKHRKSVAIRYM